MSQFKQSVFISLPVADLPKSIAFYQAIGLTLKMNFPDETGTGLKNVEKNMRTRIFHQFCVVGYEK